MEDKGEDNQPTDKEMISSSEDEAEIGEIDFGGGYESDDYWQVYLNKYKSFQNINKTERRNFCF